MKIKLVAGALAAFIIAMPFVAVVATANAQTFRADQSVAVASGDTIDGSAYLAGSSVDVSGKVDGDLYCAGQNVTISGEVTGDVLCAGQTLTISGTVAGSVRLAGQTMSLNGTINKSATLAGQAITLHKDGKIGQDATIMGQNVTIDGTVARDLVVSSANANLNAVIGRNVTATIDTLHLASSAAIGGTLNYTSPQKLTSADGSVVTGKVTYTKMEEAANKDNEAFNPLGMVLWAFMLIVSAVIFALLFPQALQRVTLPGAQSVSRALMAVLVGFVSGVVMPVAILILMITVLGVPFAVVALLAWILVLALSGAFAAYYVGRIVWRAQTNVVLVMFVGAVIVTVLLMIPIVNVFVWLLCVWYGSGAILLGLKDTVPVPVYNVGATEKPATSNNNSRRKK